MASAIARRRVLRPSLRDTVEEIYRGIASLIVRRGLKVEGWGQGLQCDIPSLTYHWSAVARRQRSGSQGRETERGDRDRDTRLAESWMTLCSIQAPPSCPTRDKVGCEHGCSSGRRSQGTPGAEGEGLDLAQL